MQLSPDELAPYKTGEAAKVLAGEMLDACAIEFKAVYLKTKEDDKATRAANAVLDKLKNDLRLEGSDQRMQLAPQGSGY
jgi:hypothetical protein